MRTAISLEHRRPPWKIGSKSTGANVSMTITSKDAEAVSELRIGLMRLARRLRRERPDDELTPSQLAVLGSLARQGPMTPGELARAEQVKPPSMTRMVASLEEAGLVEKAAHPHDGRLVVVALTEQARHRIEQSRRRKDAWLTQQLARLPEEERRQVLDSVRVLNRLALLEDN